MHPVEAALLRWKREEIQQTCETAIIHIFPWRDFRSPAWNESFYRPNILNSNTQLCSERRSNNTIGLDVSPTWDEAEEGNTDGLMHSDRVRPTIHHDLAEKSKRSCHLSPGSLCLSHAILPRCLPAARILFQGLLINIKVNKLRRKRHQHQDAAVSESRGVFVSIFYICALSTGVCVFGGRKHPEMPRRPSPSSCASRFTSPSAPAAMRERFEPPASRCTLTWARTRTRVVRSYLGCMHVPERAWDALSVRNSDVYLLCSALIHVLQEAPSQALMSGPSYRGASTARPTRQVRNKKKKNWLITSVLFHQLLIIILHRVLGKSLTLVKLNSVK